MKTQAIAPTIHSVKLNQRLTNNDEASLLSS